MSPSCCAGRWEATWKRSKVGQLSVSQTLANHLSTSRQVSEVILDHSSYNQLTSCPNPVGAKLGVKPMLSHSKAYILNSNMILTFSKCVLFLRTLMRVRALTTSIKTAWHAGNGGKNLSCLCTPSNYIQHGLKE